jgi:hypothetical protein
VRNVRHSREFYGSINTTPTVFTRNRATFIREIPCCADSLYNDVINHTRTACVYVINTHVSAGFDRGSDDFTLVVHNVTGPVENIPVRLIRAVRANNESLAG